MSCNLKRILAEKNITLSELARALNKAPANISYFEKVALPARDAELCEEYLDVNAFDILGSDMFTLKPRSKEDVNRIIHYLNNLEMEK